jgi:hypothetical protein
MRFNARLDTSHHGLQHPCKGAGVVADSLDRHPQCDGEVPICCQDEMHTQGFLGVPTDNKPEDAILAWSVEIMQWFLLYLSVSHDRCC